MVSSTIRVFSHGTRRVERKFPLREQDLLVVIRPPRVPTAALAGEMTLSRSAKP
jgi:hypothetical protein